MNLKPIKYFTDNESQISSFNSHLTEIRWGLVLASRNRDVARENFIIPSFERFFQ